MKIAFIGTYPPRECGIGTFTHNLYHSIIENAKKKIQSVEGYIVALDDYGQQYNYPEEVKMTIRQDQQRDYLEAVKFINLSDANVAVLQHEFGIFGGKSGVYILPMLYRLKIPLIVTLHTILKEPSYSEKEVLQKVCQKANKVVVMSKKAIEFLVSIYGVNREKIAYIEHGVPDLLFNQKQAMREFRLENRKIILTFGFVSRNKGIETVIKALPELVKQHPDILYLILGKTHPNVIKHSGEEYRIYLQKLVKSLNLSDNVVFLNKYVNQKELFKYLSACDIYVTPYLNEAQITSGTLSYAVGVGSAVVSTPYWHASELLDNGRGFLFDFKDTKQLSSILSKLLSNPELLKKIRKKAYDYGRTFTWEKSGLKYINLLKPLLTLPQSKLKEKQNVIDPLILPPFTIEHIKRLTDDTGIIQHAKFGIPNLKEGYCLDDNARALLMVLMAYRETKDRDVLNLAPIYLSYIHYMQNNNGTFKNMLSFNRTYLDDIGTEDAFGRTVWALGYLMAHSPNDAYYQAGKILFLKTIPNFEKLTSIRAIASTIIGLSYYLVKHPGDDEMNECVRSLSYKLVHHFKENSNDDWQWFESILAYDNGILPLALLHAAELFNDDAIKQTAFASMNFLTQHTIKEGYLSIIGNEKWYKKDGERSRFAQQPIDAMAMVLMFQQAFNLTKNQKYLNKLFTSFMWFLGENDIRMNLYDFETNGCCDGIESYGINRNQGAESTLAFLISHLAVLSAFEESEKEEEKNF